MSTVPPRWRPEDEDELRQAIDDGALEENHYCDVKRSLGDTPSARKETARDLASFAIDGGTLIVGVDEDKQSQTLSLVPQALAGLPERIEQVATTAIDPPLFVVTHVIPSTEHATHGYIVVDVPPSPGAPHMVENVYFGRGDKTKVRPSDPEVLRFHSRREAEEAIASRLLDTEVARDHVPRGEQKTGRLYVVAQPLRAPSEVARDLVRGTGDFRGSDFWTLINQVEPQVHQEVREFAPTPEYASTPMRRAQGMARVSQVASGPGRTFNTEATYGDETDLLDLEFREDGGIRVLMGRMTTPWGKRYAGDESTLEVIADGLAVAYAHRVVLWAAGLGERVGYRGPWVFGIHAHGLRGLLSSVHLTSGWGRHDGQHYDADEYRQVTTAQHEEILGTPGEVAYRLVGRLTRGLGSDQKYKSALIPPVAPGQT